MDPISNIDRLVLVLRQRLQEQARTSAHRAGERSRADRAEARGLDSVQALAGVEGVDDHQLGRALIQSILADHFGPELINDAKFQQVVDRVTETLEQDEGGAALLGRMVGELRGSAG